MAQMTVSIGPCSKFTLASDNVAVLHTAMEMLRGHRIELEEVQHAEVFRGGTLPRMAFVSHMSNASEYATRCVIGKSFGPRKVMGFDLARELTVRIGQWLRRANDGACARCAIIVQTAHP